MVDQVESAAEYIDAHNFKSLVEWLTAEVSSEFQVELFIIKTT